MILEEKSSKLHLSHEKLASQHLEVRNIIKGHGEGLKRHKTDVSAHLKIQTDTLKSALKDQNLTYEQLDRLNAWADYFKNMIKEEYFRYRMVKIFVKKML